MRKYGMAVLALLTGWTVWGAVGAGFDAHTSRMDSGTNRSSQYSFEEDGDSRAFSVQNGRLSLSPDHFKHGQKSLRWDFARRGKLTLNDPDGMALLSKRAGGLKMWLYAEKPLTGTLRIQGLKEGRPIWSFDYRLGFTGWRALWLSVFDDAQWASGVRKGTPAEVIRFTAMTGSGTLFFDRLELIDNVLWCRESDFHATVAVSRNNGGVDGTLRSWRKPPLPDPRPVTPADRAAAEQVATRVRKWLNGSTDAAVIPEVSRLRGEIIRNGSKAIAGFDRLGIVRHADGRITGPPCFSVEHAGSPTASHTIGRWLLPLALLYATPGTPEVANPHYHDQAVLDRVILGLDHLHDQGWAAGSSMGSSYGLGLGLAAYNMILLTLRDELLAAQRLVRESETLKYYSHFNDLNDPAAVDGENGADQLRSISFFQLVQICFIPDPDERVRMLRRFQASIDRCLATTRALRPFIKPDGCVFHHSALYLTGYGNNGLEMGARIAYFLRGTPFAVSAESAANLKRALLTSRFAAQKYDHPVQLNGRWPFWPDTFVPAFMGFGYVAMLGDKPDPELAAAFNRLNDPEHCGALRQRLYDIDYQANTFTSTVGNLEDYRHFTDAFREIPAEPTPQGAMALPYGGCLLIRRGEKLVCIKGNSRYVWDFENESCGMLSRYLSRGTIFIYDGGMRRSGYDWQGFDWAHFPGGTAPVADFAELDSKAHRDPARHFTPEAAVGPMAFGSDGIFMLRFADGWYDRSFRFDQSVFAVGNALIVLGSGIRSDAATPVHTTLFQHLPPAGAAPLEINGERIDGTDFERVYRGPVRIRDFRGVTYLVPEAENLVIRRARQSFPTSHGRETGGEALAEIAWFDHGSAPRDTGFAYTILLDDTAPAPEYRVLKCDRDAHVIEVPAEKLTLYAVFDPAALLPGAVARVSEPGIVAVRDRGDALEITACGVDFGKNFVPYPKDGDFWRAPVLNYRNRPNTMRLGLRGRFSAAGRNLPVKDGASEAAFSALDGLPATLVLKKE